jgi:hypothetical protein
MDWRAPIGPAVGQFGPQINPIGDNTAAATDAKSRFDRSAFGSVADCLTAAHSANVPLSACR